MADAKVYQKTAQDKVVILNVRGFEVQPFIAPNWMDLRVGFFLSLTSALADDTITGLAETITNTGSMQPQDRYYLGVVRNASPLDPFIGFTNTVESFPNTSGDSVLVSSDSGLGTTNANFWRPANSANNIVSAAIYNAGAFRTVAVDGLQQHFVQDAAGAGGYAVLLGLQLLRDNAQSLTVRVNIKSSGQSADMLYSNTPTLDVLRQALEAWPASKQLGPVTLNALPDSFYFYWPFRNSRLRIHSYGVVKAK
jgi:hypothetical protein